MQKETPCGTVVKKKRGPAKNPRPKKKKAGDIGGGGDGTVPELGKQNFQIKCLQIFLLPLKILPRAEF